MTPQQTGARLFIRVRLPIVMQRRRVDDGLLARRLLLRRRCACAHGVIVCAQGLPGNRVRRRDLG
jgi:hypothetical protein